MNKVTRSISAAALILGIFVSFSLSARAGTLSVTNGSFTNLSSNSVTGGGWYGGVPAGWTTTAVSNPYSVLESGGIYYANMQTLAPNSNAALSQNVGTIDLTSDITLTFTRTLLGGGSILESGIFNLADGNAFATNNTGTISSAGSVSYTAKGVAPGTALYIAFWAAGGAPGITDISILDSATTYLWNGGVSGVWTNGGGGWTDKFDSTATNYDNAKPVVAQFTNAAAGTSVSVGGNVVVGNVQVGGTNYTFSGGSITMTNTTWSVGASVTNIVASTLAGTTGLTKSDSGTLALDASNSYSGTTAVNAGRLAIAHGNALGSTADGTIVASGAQLLLVATNSGFTVGNEALTISGQGVTSGGALRNNSGDNTWQGNITLAANATIGAASGTSLTLDAAAGNAISGSGHSLTFDGAGTNRVLDSISLGAGAITKTGTGQTILAASNSYSGGTTLSLGTLTISNANALGSGNLMVDGGTLDLGGNNLTAANLGGTGGTISLGANTLTASMTTGGQFDGTISGSGGLVKTGASFLTLAGSNSYTGGTTVDAGTLFVLGSGTLGDAAGAVTVDGTGASLVTLDLRNLQTRTGTITMSGQNARLLSGDVNNPGSVVNNGGALQFGGGLISASISGTGGLNVTGGGSLNSSNSFTGATTISATTGWYGVNTLFVVNAHALGAASGDLTISGGTVNLQDNTITRSGNVTISGGMINAGTLSKDGGNFGIQGGTVNAVLAGTAGLVKSGAGTATLGASNSYAGATDLQAGTLSLSGSGRLGGAAVTISNGATLAMATTGINVLSNSIAGAGALVAASGDTRITGDVTTTGGLTINSGTVRIGNGGTTGSYTGNTALNGGTLAFDRSDTFTYGGIISGNGSLSKVSSGTVVLAGSSTNFSGTLTIFAGTARLGDGATNGVLSGNASISAGGTLAFDRSDNSSYTGTISGAGSVAKVNTGAMTLSASNSYSGTTTLFAGTLVADNSNALGSGNITFSSGGGNTGTIRYTAASAGTDWGARFKNSTGTIRLDTDGNNVALAGAIDSSNTQGLVKSGSGSLTLSGANAYTGTTAVTAGVLELASTGGAAAGGTSALIVGTGATLLLSQSDQVNDAATVTLSGGTIRRASGVSEVFGNLTLSSGSFLDYGTGATGTLRFGTYAPANLLTVQNFAQGNVLRFGSDVGSFLPTGGALTNSFFSFNNAFAYDSGTFTITAIPEPSTYVVAVGLLGLMLWPARRLFVCGSLPQSSPAAR